MNPVYLRCTVGEPCQVCREGTYQEHLMQYVTEYANGTHQQRKDALDGLELLVRAIKTETYNLEQTHKQEQE